jgi:predicted NAD/FAD-dependent oxidoreductase
LLTTPPSQAAELLGSEHPLSRRLADIEMQPCWALMLGYERVAEIDFDAAFVNSGPVSWLARRPRATGRDSPGEAWVVHASPGWSSANLELAPEAAALAIREAVADISHSFGREARVCTAHRWRYARARNALEGPILCDDSNRLVVAGDWCAGERIEGAWISAVAAAKQLDRY